MSRKVRSRKRVGRGGGRGGSSGEKEGQAAQCGGVKGWGGEQVDAKGLE